MGPEGETGIKVLFKEKQLSSTLFLCIGHGGFIVIVPKVLKDCTHHDFWSIE